MIERKVDYGTEHEVSVLYASKDLITVHALKINEAFVLMGHGMEILPKPGDKGTIIFEKDQRGHWQYYTIKPPETPLLKLYAFQPNGNGEYSFFVVADSEKKAFEFVDQYIKETLTKPDGSFEYEAGGWGTDYYEVTTVFSLGEVCENDND